MENKCSCCYWYLYNHKALPQLDQINLPKGWVYSYIIKHKENICRSTRSEPESTNTICVDRKSMHHHKNIKTMKCKPQRIDVTEKWTTVCTDYLCCTESDHLKHTWHSNNIQNYDETTERSLWMTVLKASPFLPAASFSSSPMSVASVLIHAVQAPFRNIFTQLVTKLTTFCNTKIFMIFTIAPPWTLS